MQWGEMTRDHSPAKEDQRDVDDHREAERVPQRAEDPELDGRIWRLVEIVRVRLRDLERLPASQRPEASAIVESAIENAQREIRVAESRLGSARSSQVEGARRRLDVLVAEATVLVDAGGAAADRVASIPDHARAGLEAATGAELGGVRLHSGPAASAIAASQDARAVTIGQDIHFAEGEDDYQSDGGEHLLAHEIAHVVQQRGTQPRADAKRRGAVDDVAPAEREADRFADAFVAGGPAPPLVQSTGTVAAPKRRDATATPSYDEEAEPAVLIASTESLVFGAIGIGQESDPQAITLTNAGATPVRIEDISAFPGPSPEFPTYGALEGALAAGDSIDLRFAFRPTREGPHSSLYQVITAGGVASATIRVEGTGVSDARSETPLLKAKPRRVDFPTTMAGEWSETASLRLTNEGRQPVTIEDLALEGARPTDFAIVGKDDGQSIEPGQSTELGVAFKPEEIRGSRRLRKATLAVKANLGAEAAKVRLRGLADPTREKTEEELAAEDAEDLLARAADGDDVAASTTTYRDMLGTLLAAQRLTERGDDDSYRQARSLVEPVDERMSALEPLAEKKLGDYGSAFSTGVAIFGRAHTAVYEWKHKLRLEATINTDYLVTTFQVGEEAIKLATGELDDAPNLRAVERGGKYTAMGVAGLAAAAVAAPLIAELAPVLAGEAALLWESGKWIGAELAVWALANPESAIVLSELLLGLGITIGEGGWGNFAAQFDSPEGFFFFLLQLVQDAMHLAQTSDAGTPAAGRRPADAADDGAPPSPRTEPAEVEHPGQTKRDSESGGAIPGGLTKDAEEVHAKVVAQARDIVDALSDAIRPNKKVGAGQKSAPVPERVTEPKPGLFADVDPSVDPIGWRVVDTPVEKRDGTRRMRTEVVVDGKSGEIIRAYDPGTKTFVMESAFLDDLPRWVDVGTPLVAGKGIPTVTYLTLRQMKLLGVEYGGISKVKMSSIQNLEAIIQLHVMRTKGEDPNAAVLKTHSVQYADTSVVQSGHRVVGAEVTGDIWENRTIGWLMKHREAGDPAMIAKHDQLLKDHGDGIVTRDTVTWMNYDIVLEIVPYASGRDGDEGGGK